MAKVTYNGPQAEVLVPKAGKTFKRGEESECPDAVAKGLNPETWTLPDGLNQSPKPTKAAASTKPQNTKEKE